MLWPNESRRLSRSARRNEACIIETAPEKIASFTSRRVATSATSGSTLEGTTVPTVPPVAS